MFILNPWFCNFRCKRILIRVSNDSHYVYTRSMCMKKKIDKKKLKWNKKKIKQEKLSNKKKLLMPHLFILFIHIFFLFCCNLIFIIDLFYFYMYFSYISTIRVNVMQLWGTKACVCLMLEETSGYSLKSLYKVSKTFFRCVIVCEF